jgi:alanine racemase
VNFALTGRQRAPVEDVVRYIAGIDVPIRLGESSATLGAQDRPRLNAIDPGHLLYGLVPVGRSLRPAGLRPALRSLTSRIIHIKTVKRSEYQEQSRSRCGRACESG